MAAKKRSSGRAGGEGAKKKGRTVDAAAREATRQARRAGAYGPRSGPGAAARRAARDKAILVGHRAGRPTAELAREWGIAQRSVQDVIKRARSRRSPLEEIPMDLVEGALREYLEMMDTWATMAAGMLEADQWAPAVGAMRGYAEAFERYMATLTELGKLPEDLAIFRAQSDYQRLGSLCLQALRRAAAGEISMEAASEVVHDLVDRPQIPATLEGEAHDV